MMTLATCSTCTGFIPPAAALCPHCGAAHTAAPAAPRRGSKLLAAASTGLMAITLMACYGGGPDPDPSPQCKDADGDGFPICYDGSEDQDCDDNDASIYPGAPDPPDDGIDQNCDGVGGPAPTTTDASTTDAGTTAETTTDASTTG